MPGSRTLLKAQNLSVERGGRVLFSDLSLTIGAGELLHLRGANGAGKTTLLRILAGLSRYGYDGEITLREPCLFSGHSSAVKAALTPRENLAWNASGEDYGSRERIDGALDAVGLAGYEQMPTGRLSAGQQRRVNLARLYLTARPLWLLDEPFTAIDAPGVEALTQRMRAHCDGGGSVVLTTHQELQGAGAVRNLSLDESGAH